MKTLSGRTAVVTGGCSGIGLATAVALAREGAKVWAGDLRLRPSDDEQFRQAGIQQRQCDVQSEDDVRQLIEAASDASGKLDILVHSAGVVLVKQIPDVTESEWDTCFDTNVKGAFFTAKHAIPRMKAAGGGSIVTISSNAGLLPRAHDPVYSTSKAAVLSLTKSLALCHSVDRIRVNTVCPGPVEDTGIVDADLARAEDPDVRRRQLIDASPMARAWGRMVRPDEVAAAVLYLVSDAAAMITGTAIAIDGGKSLGVPPKD